MLTPELLARLTPEAIAGLDPKNKRRAIEILKELELTEWQRYWRDLRDRVKAEQLDYEQRRVNYWEERRANGLPGLAELLAEARKNRDNPDRKPTLGQVLMNKPDEIARQERLRSECEEKALALAASFKKAQESYVEREVAWAASKTPSVQETAREVQEQTIAEACGTRDGWLA